MKTFRKIKPLLVCGLALTLFTAAQGQNRSSISGFVFDTSRNPVSQIPVELRNEVNTLVGRTRTDGGGRYLFSGLGHGRFTIRALPFGTAFVEQTAEVEITGTGVRGQALTDHVQQDIYLKTRRSANAIPFKSGTIYVQEVPREAEALLKDAVSDLDSGRLQTGVASLERAIAIFPTYFAALERLGAVRLIEGNFDAAIELFKRALAVNERGFDSWYGLGYASYSLRKFPDAVSAAEKAVFLRPDSMEANLLLGMSKRIVKDFPNAEKALKKAAKLAEGTSADVHWQLALLYGKDMNKFAEAAKELEHFLALSPDAPNKEDVKKLIKQFKEKGKGSS